MDFGLPGPDGGKGVKHLIVPPDYDGEVPSGYYTGTSTTNRAVVLLRALPIKGDNRGAIELMNTVSIRPLDPVDDWQPTEWVDSRERVVHDACSGRDQPRFLAGVAQADQPRARLRRLPQLLR